MIWPFADDATRRAPTNFRYRNGVLVALSETLVVVQAALQSGSRNACALGRELGTAGLGVPGAPWMTAFCGSQLEIEPSRRSPLLLARQLFRALGLRAPPTSPTAAPHAPPKSGRAPRPADAFRDPSGAARDEASWTTEEKLVFSMLFDRPRHVDQIVDRTGLRELDRHGTLDAVLEGRSSRGP